MTANPTANGHQNQPKFSGWRFRLKKAVKNASDGELESTINWLERTEWLCGALVALGVLFEFLIAWKNPPYGNSLERWGPFWADLLVLAGVGGEVIASMRVTICQGELTQRSNDRLTEANDRLSRVELDSGFMEETIAKAQERAAELGREIAAANERTLEAQLALEKYKAPRLLTPEQQTNLVEKLKPFAGQKVSFNVSQEPEAIGLMRLIDGVLKRAGWLRIGPQVGVIVIDNAGVAHDEGLQIGIKRETPEAIRAIAIRLSELLTAEALPAVPAYIAELKVVDAININVGKKP